jgi:glyoxylase I family protein
MQNESARPAAAHQRERKTMTTASPMTIQGIDHVVLRVSDMVRTRQFYCDVLGCRVEKVQEAIGLVQLRAGGSLIDLVDVAGKLGQMGGAPPGREGRNMDHFCLRIEPFDAAKIRAHLQAQGVTPGEVVSRYGAEGEGPSMYITDPEGNGIELKGPPAA